MFDEIPENEIIKTPEQETAFAKFDEIEDREEIPFQELTPEQKAEIEKFEKAQISERFESLGIEKVDLGEIPLERQEEIVSAFENMFEQHPELENSITEIGINNECREAVVRPTLEGGWFSKEVGCKIEFNEETFCNPDYEGADGFETAGKGIDAIVAHECGHVLDFKMEAQEQGFDIGEKVAKNDFMVAIEKWDEGSGKQSEVIQSSLDKMEVSVDDADSEKSKISLCARREGNSECFAEAFADYYTSDEPSELSKHIVEEYKKRYQNNA